MLLQTLFLLLKRENKHHFIYTSYIIKGKGFSTTSDVKVIFLNYLFYFRDLHFYKSLLTIKIESLCLSLYTHN